MHKFVDVRMDVVLMRQVAYLIKQCVTDLFYKAVHR